MHKHTNHLIHETSPYLLQHAHNPVNWYPWGEETLEKAKEENKPILVSIGYAACHWCHVMERESFEDEATAQIMAEVPSTRVLILSMHTTEDFVRRAIKAGAAGYLVKDSAPLDLKMAIAAVLRGEIYLSPRVSRHLVSGFLHGKPHQNESSMDALTARQREILQMIAEGKSTKQIAYQLNVSIKTIETHRAALMERLDIHDVAGLVLYAVRHGVISVDRTDP